MTKKRQRQKENGKLSITQKKAALKVIEDEEAKFGLKPPSQRFLASKISEKLGRLVTHTTVRKLQKEKALIEKLNIKTVKLRECIWILTNNHHWTFCSLN